MGKNNKDNMSNLFNRYVWLVDIIYRRKRITFEEINEYWRRSSLNFSGEDIPLRTFHNHRKAIEQMFDINIECDKRGGYQYYIENSEDMERGGVRSWLLNTFAVNNLINESHKIKERILFEKIPSGQMHLTPIIEAMRDNQSVEITYQSFWNDSPATFEIYPYCIKVFKQRWYVIAFSPYKERILIYALDRIKNIKITENSFHLPEDFDGESFFADSYGIIMGDEIETERVVIRVGGNQERYIKSLPLHHSQKEEETTPEYTLFSYQIKPTFDFRQELLSYGADIEVLNPEWFRDEIAEIISEQYTVYGDKMEEIKRTPFPFGDTSR
ncbi:helix-turn-helix transcriptional regulator [Petrimonas sp.]|uniref:helix-turn-helix transcriptional regulator n=1 Tax=Petrimonas sp. TaxID=2023866 RepID=UPI003F5147C0